MSAVRLRDGRELTYAETTGAWSPESGARLRRGLTVCLLAPDGAGKSTLCDGLEASLPVPTSTMHMGLYVRGRRELPIPGVRLLARIGSQWRRYLRGRRHAAGGGVVIFDRYPYDALLPAPGPMSRPDRMRRAALARILPAPDLALVLDAPAAVLHGRKAEHPLAHVERQRAGYRSLAGRLPCPVEIVDVSGDAEAVRRRVSAVLWRTLAERGT